MPIGTPRGVGGGTCSHLRPRHGVDVYTGTNSPYGEVGVVLMKIIGIGDNVVDYYEHQGLMYPGGNALNVPVLCKRLAAGAIEMEQHGEVEDDASSRTVASLANTTASYIGIIGTDKAGNHILEVLTEEGINVSRVRQAAGSNGEARVTLRDGDRVFVGSDAGVQKVLSIRLSKDDLAFIHEHDLVHTSVYSYMEGELPKLAKLPVDVSFDFSDHRDSAYLGKVCPNVTLAFFSGSDLSVDECTELMNQVATYDVRTVVVTRGAEGAICLHDGQMFTQAAMKTAELVDTLGAGDAFIAGFLLARANGRAIPYCLEIGAQAAAKTCSYYGAFGHPLAKVSF